jgi:hypothetical protein
MTEFLVIGLVIATMVAILDELEVGYMMKVLCIWSSIGIAFTSFATWIVLVGLYILLLYMKYQRY